MDRSERKQYNGKEKVEEFGLFWNDHGARNYDLQIQRWGQVDPLSAKYPDITPYAFGINNPVRFFDPDGREVVDAMGNRVTYSKSDSFSYSGKDEGTKLVIASMQATDAGIDALSSLIASPIIAEFEINTGADDGKRSEGLLLEHTAGFGSVADPSTGGDVYKSALIQIFTGSLGVINSTSKDKEQYMGATMTKFVNGVTIHEITHALGDVETLKQVQIDCKCTGEKLNEYIKSNKVLETQPDNAEKNGNTEYDKKYPKP